MLSNERVAEHVLFYTYADIAYSVFAGPYAHFVLVRKDGAKVEILLEDLEQFQLENAPGISRLEALFSERIVFRQSAIIESKVEAWPNALRLNERPWEAADHVYIGEIDLLVLDDDHQSFIEPFDLLFSNIIRRRSLASVSNN